MNIIVRCSVY